MSRARHRPGRVSIPILVRLLVATLVPTVLTFAALGLLAHWVARRALEDELGRRLASVAQAAALAVRAERVDLLAPGDEQSRTFRNVRRKLSELRDATGSARIYVFDAERTARADTDEGVAIGTRLYALDANTAEVRRTLAGEPTASVLFTGRDGRRYKSGFAPLRSGAPDPAGDDAEPDHVVGVVGVDGAAELYERLGDLRRTLFLLGGLGSLGVVLLSVLAARRITRPVRDLVDAARVMGGGNLETPIVAGSSDEIGFLAETLEEMRQELRARDERLQMMLAGIAHEVRNPLGGMELFAGLLRDDLGGPGDEEKLSQVMRIERELAHLKTIVNDFLDYARRAPPDFRECDAAELVREVQQVLQGEAAARERSMGVAVWVEVQAPDRSPCIVDSAQLRRALLNLGRNALQALGEAGGGVTLSCAGDDQTLSLRVIDTGRGIEPEHLPRLFQPFFTTREQGTGLGLAFVAEIASAHEGTVEVDSSPGRGATFTLTVPRYPWRH